MKSISIALCYAVVCIFYLCEHAGCNPITNSNFNERIREFSRKDDINTTEVKTLQKENPKRYAELVPMREPVNFKGEDSVLSGSSHSRGLHYEHSGYAHQERDEPHYEYGLEPHYPEHDFQVGYPHHGVEHGYEHHPGHPPPEYYHKYHHHPALAAKTFLWPIAGLALLGAAAALVTNPILLQIGVVSGKRKRRDTEEVLESNIDLNKWTSKSSEEAVREPSHKLKYRPIKKTNKSAIIKAKFGGKYSTQSSSTPQTPGGSIKPYVYTTPAHDYDDVFIPVPIKLKDEV